MGKQETSVERTSMFPAAGLPESYSPAAWYPERILVAPDLTADYLERSGIVVITAGRMTIMLGDRFRSRGTAYRAAEAFCRKYRLLRGLH
jgi:hypothetical protein